MSGSSSSSASSSPSPSHPTVIVVGGAFAGISAAMALARQLVDVLVIDSALPRNRFASEAHNCLAWDGQKPLEILRQSKANLLKYPTVRWLNGKVTDVIDKSANGTPAFQVSTDAADGSVFHCKRVIVACGVKEALVDSISGLLDLYGNGVAQCPHCHGFEVRGKSLGFLTNSFPIPRIAHVLGMLANLSPKLTFFTNGVPLSAADQEVLAKFGAGIKVDERKISSVSGDKSSRALHEIHFEDGSSTKSIECIFVPPRTSPNLDSLGEELKANIELADGLTGKYVKLNDKMQTTVDGLYACGDVASAANQLLLAAADGLKTGVFVHMALMAAGH